jgi:glycosyltransferase involved in cell wall biosynthesis
LAEIISVIIPTFNRKNFLKEAIYSVLKQKDVFFEVIVVDDGSNDGTKEFIKNYPIKYFYQENKGPASARNLGIMNSNGKYIAFLDSDDLWVEDKLSNQINFFKENPDILIVHTNEIWIRNGKVLNQKKKHKKGGGDQFERSLELCVISPSSVLIKRELFDIVGTFDESFPACEDYEFWLRVTSKFKIGFVEKPLVVKRGGHRDQLSKNIPCLDFWRAKAIGKLIKENWFDEKQKEIAAKFLKKKAKIYIQGLQKRGKIKEKDVFERWLKEILNY